MKPKYYSKATVMYDVYDAYGHYLDTLADFNAAEKLAEEHDGYVNILTEV